MPVPECQHPDLAAMLEHLFRPGNGLGPVVAALDEHVRQHRPDQARRSVLGKRHNPVDGGEPGWAASRVNAGMIHATAVEPMVNPHYVQKGFRGMLTRGAESPLHISPLQVPGLLGCPTPTDVIAGVRIADADSIDYQGSACARRLKTYTHTWTGLEKR